MLKSFLSRLIADAFHVSPRRSRSRRSSPATQGALHAEALETRQLLTAGDLDLSFGGGDGIVTTAIGPSIDQANSVAVQSDGKIVTAGVTYINDGQSIVLTRSLSTGIPDETFGTAGVVITPIGAVSAARGMGVVVQPDGRIVVAGYAFVDGNSDFVVIRYDANGDLDLGFGIAGIVVVPIGTEHDFAYSLALQPDGGIILAGSTMGGGAISTMMSPCFACVQMVAVI